MIRAFHILIFVFLGELLVSQTLVDTVLILEGIEISSAKISENTSGQKVLIVDSLLLKNHAGSNVAEILTRASGIQIKSYNSGGLSTISLRGTSGQHTGIFWHGFNLNQINTGIVDLSLIPVAGFDHIDIIPGGGASLFGSGNIGGGIHLVSSPAFNQGNIAGINTGMGSFGQYDAAMYNRVSSQNWYSKTMVNLATAQNNFEYTNFRGQSGKLDNNAFSRIGIMQDISRRFRKSMLNISLWFTTMDREISPSIIEVPKDIRQSDQSFRSMFSYQFELKKPGNRIELKSGFFDEIYRFDEKNTAGIPVIETLIKTQKSQTEATYRLSLKNHLLKTGLTGIGEFGKSDNWGGDQSRLRAGIYLLYTLNIPSIKWKASANIRQEIAEGYNIPFTPSIGAEGSVLPWLTAKINYSRNFRIPTFNELYWLPGGNTDLKPEDSQNAETSLIVKPLLTSKTFHLKASGTLYSSWVKNWILWIPVSTWTEPQNIQTVWSRGIESELHANWKHNKFSSGISGGYSFTKSTVEEKELTNDASNHKQLIYVPLHTFFSNIHLQVQGFVLNYNHRFNGMVYTTSDNLESLPGFQLGEFNLSKSLTLGKSTLRLQTSIINVWDEDYQVVENYPNPGRSFKIAVNYEIKYR